MIKFKTSGLVYINILSRIENKFNFDVDIKHSQLLNEPLHHDSLTFKAEPEEGRKLLNFILTNRDKLLPPDSSKQYKFAFDNLVKKLSEAVK